MVELGFCCLSPYTKIVKTEYNYTVFCVDGAQKLWNSGSAVCPLMPRLSKLSIIILFCVEGAPEF